MYTSAPCFRVSLQADLTQVFQPFARLSPCLFLFRRGLTSVAAIGAGRVSDYSVTFLDFEPTIDSLISLHAVLLIKVHLFYYVRNNQVGDVLVVQGARPFRFLELGEP